jgi:hypothetical protein
MNLSYSAHKRIVEALFFALASIYLVGITLVVTVAPAIASALGERGSHQ